MPNLPALPNRDLPGMIQALFEFAKQCDEVEFCRALLRGRSGVTDVPDNLQESRRLMEQVVALIEGPIHDGLRLRLLLSLYHHATGMRDLYGLAANLMRIATGKGFHVDPFAADQHPSGRAAQTAVEKASRLSESASKADLDDFGELFVESFVPEIRDAYGEGTYSLDERFLYVVAPAGAEGTDGKYDLAELLPRLNRAILVAIMLIDTAEKFRRSYQTTRQVHDASRGTMVELVGRPGSGLEGVVEIASSNPLEAACEKPAESAG